MRTAYSMPTDVDPLAFLLELNLACAAKEKVGEKITPPGLPLPANEHARFITDDCIKPPVISAFGVLQQLKESSGARDLWDHYL